MLLQSIKLHFGFCAEEFKGFKNFKLVLLATTQVNRV